MIGDILSGLGTIMTSIVGTPLKPVQRDAIEILGLNIARMADFAGQVYAKGSHLLCHDDVIGTRKVQLLQDFGIWNLWHWP